MPKRTSALRALEQLTKANDADSDASGDSDYKNEDFDSEVDYVESDDSTNDESDNQSDVDIDSFECANGDQQTSGQSGNEDKTSKSGVIWNKMNDSDETKIRKRIFFNEKAGPTSYAATRLDKSSLSAFLVIFDMAMVKMVVECTNVFAQTIDHQ